MVELGSASFVLDVPCLPGKEFENYSTALFDEWERLVSLELTLPDYSISLEVEEGSIKGSGRIAAAAGILYLGIGQYGDFVSGLETIHSQISHISTSLFSTASEKARCLPEKIKTRKSAGVVSRLRGLFEKVRSGQLTPDEATLRARALFGDEADEVSEMLAVLKKELESATKYPQQMDFADEECMEFPVPERRVPIRDRRPTPGPAPSAEQHRIVIWRESKASKKQVRMDK